MSKNVRVLADSAYMQNIGIEIHGRPDSSKPKLTREHGRNKFYERGWDEPKEKEILWKRRKKLGILKNLKNTGDTITVECNVRQMESLRAAAKFYLHFNIRATGDGVGGYTITRL